MLDFFSFFLSLFIFGITSCNKQREKKGKEIKHPLSTRGVLSVEYTDVEIKICSFSCCEYTQQKMKKKRIADLGLRTADVEAKSLFFDDLDH